MPDKYQLTVKEVTAITALKEVAKIWPHSLSVGEDPDSKWCVIWKDTAVGADSVGKVKIRNQDAW